MENYLSRRKEYCDRKNHFDYEISKHLKVQAEKDIFFTERREHWMWVA